MTRLTPTISIPDGELEFHAIRAQGPGGQHVNKVSSAVQLRFDVAHSSLPARVRENLLARGDRRLSRDGVLVIKAQRHRSQEKNRAEALDRLRELVTAAAVRPKTRVPTRPGRAARRRRMDSKTRRGQVKSLRGPVRED